MPVDLLALYAILQKNLELYSVFDYKSITTYIEIVNLLKPKLETLRASYQAGPPPTLPVNIHEFLKLCFSMSDFMGKLAWESFSNFAWNSPFSGEEEQQAAIIKHMSLFLEYGIPWKIGIYNLQPPTRVCVDSRCNDQLHANPTTLRDRELGESIVYPITIFTKDLGAIPAYATSMYFRKCNTHYYNNYYVQNALSKDLTRIYYLIPPQFIQTSQHFYIAVELCELFSTMLVMSFTSATNCAHIYNQGLKNDMITPLLPPDWQTSLDLDANDVWSGFFLHALILDRQESRLTLQLFHRAKSQVKRLQPALQARNVKMAGPGQEAWNHVCDRCCYIYEDNGKYYQVRSVVTDGITIGRPTCSIQDCTHPLSSIRNHYCNIHYAFAQICIIVKCEQKAETGFQTCALEEHCKLELYHYQRGKAMFQLKRRLKRTKVSQSTDSLSTKPRSPTKSRLVKNDLELSAGAKDLQPLVTSEFEEGDNGAFEEHDVVEDEDIAIDGSDICDGKPETGNCSVKAQFGRRWTHNEQLCVASCGVILGRATFYGSEAPNGVRTFWKTLFPTKASLPFVLWHDNNCRVMAMLERDPDDQPDKHYFDCCALAVDVFHFNCKHKESDEACNRDCNPYKWPELRTPDGNWRFNSSAAEQANVWFGGFQAIVQDMQADRYEFFLDEMIKRRNRMIIKELQRRGEKPYFILREELLRPDSD